MQLKINKMPVIHIVDRYFKATQFFNITNDLKGLDFFIPKKDEVKIVTKPTENNIKLKEKIIANKEHKQHRILKKEGIDQTNIIEGKRNRIQRVA
jgi:hypothetical protein